MKSFKQLREEITPLNENASKALAYATKAHKGQFTEDMQKKYGKGLAKSTNQKRAAQFKKQAKMDDDDPDAYKPAPGDKTAKTKPSKHTKKFKQMFGENKAVKNKAEKSGMPYSILKKVYDRGVAAWRTGHRPGTTPEQWALARINSFLTGGKTRTTADADLWAKAQKLKKNKK